MSIYFLKGEDKQAQIWRLESDVVTLSQITEAENGINEFSVSNSDGSIAFISDNHLYLVDADGDDQKLIADDSRVDWEAEDAAFRSYITNPVFSPDGRLLAYGFNGLHIYDLEKGTDEHILTNLGNLLGEVFVFSKEIYVPGSWSPDGQRLLIVMSYYEGSTLALMKLGEGQPFQRLRSAGLACCQFTWSQDSQSVLVSNPYYTIDLPGLWKYDAATGKKTVLIPGIREDGSLDYAGWPFQKKNGDLYFFTINLASFSPDTGIPLKMVMSESDGSGQKEIMDESMRIWDILWAEDGTQAVVLGRDQTGAVKLWIAGTDGKPFKLILDDAQEIRNLEWGP